MLCGFGQKELLFEDIWQQGLRGGSSLSQRDGRFESVIGFSIELVGFDRALSCLTPNVFSLLNVLAIEQRERQLAKLLGLLVLRSRPRQRRRPLVHERPHLPSEVVLRLQLETQVDAAHCYQQRNRERSCPSPPETNRSVRRVE